MAGKRIYSDEFNAWAREYIPGHCEKEIAEEANRLFPGINATASKMRAYKKNYGIKSGTKYCGGYPKYSKEVFDFIAENVNGKSDKQLHQMLVDKYGDVMSVEKLHAFKKNHHLRNGRDGRFRAGNIPYTKGKKWDEFMSPEAQKGSRKTCYQKGNRPHNYMPVGSTRILFGYLQVKVADPDVWKWKHRIVYEQHYGPIPKGKMICFKDGNRMNLDPENLMLMSNEENLKMNHLKLRSESRELTETGIIIARVAIAAKKRSINKEQVEKEMIKGGEE